MRDPRVKPRLLVFGADFLYELVHASPDFDVDFYSTVSPKKFVLRARLEQHAPETLERCPVRWWSVADLPGIAKKLDGGEYHAVLCQQIQYGLWSSLQPLHRNLRLARQTLARERASLIRFVLPRMLRRSGVPMAFVSPGDAATIEPQNSALLRASRLCFVRELPIEPANLLVNAWPKYRRIANVSGHRELNWLWSRLRPLSVGLRARPAAVIERHLVQRPDEKTIDVFFAGRPAPHTVRDGFYLQQLSSLRREGWRIEIVEDRVPQDTFFEKCCRSWLVWSPQGLGWDGWRHYEAAAAAAVPVINMPTIRRYAPLEHGRHALFYGVEGNDLRNVIGRALGDKGTLWEMGRAARQHVLEHHLHRRLLQHVVTSVRTASVAPNEEVAGERSPSL